ncbi:MAG: glycogen/starch synthase [Deltaproteobacteria bacterium]|nr:glycogen/starch synthase [Deltaproteobacteria bacterium]
MKKIAFLTYETPWAKGGGIAAVIAHLPAAVRQASGLDTFVISPLHFRCQKMPEVVTESAGELAVPFQEASLRVDVRRLVEAPAYLFLQPDDGKLLHGEEERLFAGLRHPYDVPAGRLRRDAVLFGAAAARALAALDPEAEWILFAQDWEAATTALATAGRQSPLPVFLTLHNSYDCPVSAGDLASVGIDAGGSAGHTVLERALPRVAAPVLTVSEQFATDLVEDPLQAKVMAPHLRESLRRRLVGVDNGPFGELQIPPEELAAARAGDFAKLRAWKADRKADAARALGALGRSPDQPVWGEPAEFLRVLCAAHPAWIVMAGRDDPRQKGYDVAVAAIERLLAVRQDAQFLFFPIPGDEGLPGLAFLQELTVRHPGNVVALPFLFQEGSLAALRGAEYGLMPSLYEPFGMAGDFYLNGTVAIGRATGGILQQVVPLRSTAAFSHAVQRRSERWHCAAALPTGILFRERDGIPSVAADWRGINAARYSVGGSPNRVNERQAFALYRHMVAELERALRDGLEVLHDEPDLYGAMAVAGVAHIRQSFSWSRAAAAYVRFLDSVSQEQAP